MMMTSVFWQILFLVLIVYFKIAESSPHGINTSGGIDVSSFQGSINWAKVKNSGVTFAIARATIGQGKQDSFFLKNWEGMRNNNITSAAYHYFHGNDTAESQLSNIETCLASTDFDKNLDALVVDVESSGNTGVTPLQMAKTLKELLLLLRDFRNILIYTNYYYWEDRVAWNTHDFSLYNLWIANYNKVPAPLIPTTWKKKGYTWWQYSESGRVDGVYGNVDLDRKYQS